MTHINDEALKLALEALTPFSTPNWAGTGVDKANEAITAIKQALAAPMQEPWGFHIQFNNGKDATFKGLGYLADCEVHLEGGETITKLYTEMEHTPPAAPVQPVQEPVAIDGNTSDGYHTFNELYEFRKAYNAALFNEWAAGGKCSVHKSWRHHDNELCFGGGWFIVVAVLPQGQISNHYEAKDWDLFAVPEVERVLFEFDGHTGADVVTRLKDYAATPAAQPALVQPEAVAEMAQILGNRLAEEQAVYLSMETAKSFVKSMLAHAITEKGQP
jgi:hypothetical protein